MFKRRLIPLRDVSQPSLPAMALAAFVGFCIAMVLGKVSAQSLSPDVSTQLSMLAPAVFYLGFSFFSLLLALARPAFADLWMFSAYCGSLFLSLWAQSSYSENFSFVVDTKAFSEGLLAVSSTGLSLAFFRFHRRWIFGGLAAAIVVVVVLSFLSFGQARALWVAAFMMLAHLIVSVAGFGVLTNRVSRFRQQGLYAFLPAMRRRIWSACVFVIVMSVWIAGFFAPMEQDIAQGTWQRILLRMVPTFALFLQFYWIIMSGQRFREKLRPKLDYIDYLAIEMGDSAREESHIGVLASFDLKGFKRLTSLKARSTRYRDAVNNLVSGMRDDIAEVIARDKTVFRFKSNGDEWVWVFHAKDAAAAKTILLDVVQTWQEHAHRILDRQKESFAKALGDDIDLAGAMVLDFVDLHTMFCVLSKITISLGDGSSFPEFYADGFTNLSEAFKTASHNAVAMFREEAEEICSRLPVPAWFEKANSSYCDAGFLKWNASDANR